MIDYLFVGLGISFVFFGIFHLIMSSRKIIRKMYKDVSESEIDSLSSDHKTVGISYSTFGLGMLLLFFI